MHNRLKCRCILLVLFSLPAESFAQFSDSTFYHLNAVALGSLNKTNDIRNYLLNNSLRFSARKKRTSFNVSNSWVYGQQQKDITNNDYTGTLDVNLYRTFPNFYYWGLGNYTTSLSLKINSQYQYGVGVAYNFFDTTNVYLNVSDGIIYENSNVFVDDTNRRFYNTFRNSLRLSFRFKVWNVFTINSTSFLQNSLAYRNDYILKTNVEASIKLKKWLSFIAAVNFNKISRTERRNFLFTYGITIDNYF
jgi:hypothetical protein